MENLDNRRTHHRAELGDHQNERGAENLGSNRHFLVVEQFHFRQADDAAENQRVDQREQDNRPEAQIEFLKTDIFGNDRDQQRDAVDFQIVEIAFVHP